MKNNLSYCYRQIKPVEMYNLMDSIEDVYKSDLKASISSYDTLDDVSTNTYEDYMRVLAKFQILYEIGLIDESEYDNLKEYAYHLRFEELNKLNEASEDDSE